ncbi:hypothetical protein [Pinibacter aurantiacus]|uniref:Uncharacterized protein n=1 Tax=Pinibacter aurantiacus TaxID=2851599 RepID=A0A9E2SA55_9BACT|nr:hypothetical protein [Pinibacter aurantiacus]MBV4357464.1 hypothetical protein [Pinibacter aurantiacus]
MTNIDQRIKDEWRELDFYYDLEKKGNKSQWRLYGSKHGLYNFVKLLKNYTTEPTNDFLSEHCHCGPYNYLKVMTWHKAEITENYIAGTIEDLKNLKNIIADKLEKTLPGQSFTIDKEHGTNNTALIKFFVMKDSFDPVSMDGNYS